MKLYRRNKFVYLITQLFHSLIFTIPVWIAFYEGRISVAEISILATIQYASQMIMELPSGALADLIGRRWTVFAGFVIGAVAYFLTPQAYTFTNFIIVAVLIGISDSFRSGAEEALIYDTLKQADRENETAKIYSKGNTIYQVGLVTATALGGFIYSINQTIPFILYGISLLIGASFAFCYIEPTIDSATFTLKNYLRQIRDGAKEAFKDTETRKLSLFYIFVAGIAWSSTLYFNAYMMIDLGFPDSERGILSAIMRLLNVVIISSVLTNEKIFNKKRTILFFPIAMIIAYLPGIFLNSYWGLPFVQIAMMVTTARWTILSPLTNALFSSKYRATAISFLSLLIGVVYILMTSISTFVMPSYGTKAMYTVMGLISLVTALPLGIALLKEKKD